MAPLKALLALAAAFTGIEARLMSRAAALANGVQMTNMAADDQQINLQIGIKLQNIDKLEPMLRDVSDPDSPNYGKYLTAAQVNDMFKPAEASVKAIQTWLANENVTDVSYTDNGRFVNFATNVGTANKMLGATFAYYDVQGTMKLRTTEYSLPNAMTEHIELVTPTTYFGNMKSDPAFTNAQLPQMPAPLSRRQGTGPSATANCSKVFTPACFELAYNYGAYQADPAAGSRVGFASFLNQSARQDDLTAFLGRFQLPAQKFTSVLVNGGQDHQDPKGAIGEANLDAQVMAAAVKTLPITQYLTGGKPPLVPNLRTPTQADNQNEPFLDFYQFMMTQENEKIPQVLSVSYGDDEQTVPIEYATRVCNLIGMMGLRGVSVLESSGDTGVGAPCRANDGSNQPQFTPQFPATCPYITAVGGTQAFGPETTWVASGSGFSNYFKQAWYQETMVAQYLQTGIPADVKAYYQPFANFTGRGFPDIAAHSASPPFAIVNANKLVGTGGTSASAPLMAGLVGLLNDARIRAGQPTMGFMNPWLYKRGFKGLTDVTTGVAQGCGGTDLQSGKPLQGSGVIPFATWNGTQGWDPVTGLGLPNFEEMKKIALTK
ncbi:Pro-kumamolisin [Colletotrichum scovillei]|uniref:tripeptidyl-peptidase II n=4 Tax=Colletotrichum acutatum species complex TaxID=2707335 RepID=A0A9P7UDQ0_9PEZI|nr:Pro-kumamolisin [Colletotrichum scovillei]XP_049139954.1 Pro-kumamolisin [Colletotrichum lupini]XP_060319613.1 Pro-kumamolisin [Colletotrichum costaricense]KAI3536830.1 Pro-kumamolisin [Colletotrichum filicis]KAK1490235.1 Pro-kumamolisin [Colletotrichum cuscutae]KAF4783301.1 Pro-kumamolisin [Colletotrichum scovillei]KAG7051306.1 tripeptidyl peptidase a [Colletotrichum scovillei]KAG7070343.1 tripeptidyl peptidase a [Colletotrichum scovillei]